MGYAIARRWMWMAAAGALGLAGASVGVPVAHGASSSSQSAAARPASSSTLRAGQTLKRDQSLRSPNGHYLLVTQRDGNVVLYGGKRALWDSQTAGNPGAFAVLQLDGNFVVYSRSERALYASGTVVRGRAARRAAARRAGR